MKRYYFGFGRVVMTVNSLTHTHTNLIHVTVFKSPPICYWFYPIMNTSRLMFVGLIKVIGQGCTRGLK